MHENKLFAEACQRQNQELKDKLELQCNETEMMQKLVVKRPRFLKKFKETDVQVGSSLEFN